MTSYDFSFKIEKNMMNLVRTTTPPKLNKKKSQPQEATKTYPEASELLPDTLRTLSTPSPIHILCRLDRLQVLLFKNLLHPIKCARLPC